MTTTTTPITLTPTEEAELAARVAAATDRRLAPLLRFTESPLHRRLPTSLLAGLTRSEYAALPVPSRVEHLRAAVAEEILRAALTDLARRKAEKTAPLAPTQPRAASRPEVPSRYVVACAGLCGEWLPATSARPVLKYCSEVAAQTAKPRRQRSDLDEQLATVRSGGGSGAGSRPSTNRSKKSRRRAVCQRVEPSTPSA